jgi:2-hydroxychromene-2-carboxylate isomerase
MKMLERQSILYETIALWARLLSTSPRGPGEALFRGGSDIFSELSIAGIAMTAPALDFWFDFASTYSYPAMMRIGGLARREAVVVNFRPFLLGPIFKVQGWTTSPFNLFPAKGRNMWRDLERTCAELGLAFRRPEPFPQSSILAARIALLGLGQRWGEDFCRAVFNAEFAEARRIDDPETMAGILSALSVDAAAVLDAAQTPGIKDKLRAETARAQALDIFGAPSFCTTDGELFWGNDRLEAALAWAKRAS